MLIHWHYLYVRRKPTEAWRHAFMSHNFDTVYDIMIEYTVVKGVDCKIESNVQRASLISTLQ